MVDLRRLVEQRVREIDGMLPGESMFGHGRAYWVNGKEVLHFDDDSSVEIRLTRAVIRELRPVLRADDRIVLRAAGADWITVHCHTAADVELVLDLASRAARAHRPPPGVAAAPPPTGTELERRKRFH